LFWQPHLGCKILKTAPNPTEIGGKIFIDFSEFRIEPIES